MIVRSYIRKSDGSKEYVGAYIFTNEKIDKMNDEWEEKQDGESKKSEECYLQIRIPIFCGLKRLGRIYRSLKIW